MTCRSCAVFIVASKLCDAIKKKPITETQNSAIFFPGHFPPAGGGTSLTLRWTSRKAGYRLPPPPPPGEWRGTRRNPCSRWGSGATKDPRRMGGGAEEEEEEDLAAVAGVLAARKFAAAGVGGGLAAGAFLEK